MARDEKFHMLESGEKQIFTTKEQTIFQIYIIERI